MPRSALCSAEDGQDQRGALLVSDKVGKHLQQKGFSEVWSIPTVNALSLKGGLDIGGTSTSAIAGSDTSKTSANSTLAAEVMKDTDSSTTSGCQSVATY